jgi:glycosyl transferase family 25
MKAYVINLKKDLEKYEKCKKKLKPLGIYPERIEAIYGKELSPQYIKEVVSPRTIHNIKLGSRDIDSEIDTLGGIGCALSHISLWNKILHEDGDEFIIFEDDLSPKVDREKLKGAIDNLPKDWDIIFLGYILPTLMTNSDTKVSNDWYKINSILFGAHAYLVNKKGVKKLLNGSLPITEHIDNYMTLRCMDDVNGYRPTEAFFSQESHKSNIGGNYCLKCYINRLSPFDIVLIILIIIVVSIVIFHLIKKI